jgi:DNA polymerase-3 subunit alpha
MCSLLTSEINNNDKDEKLGMYIKATEKMGIKCWKAHVNKSGLEFKIDKIGDQEVIRAPLTVLKGVGTKAVENIVLNQPYADLEDFVKKVDSRVVNIRVFTTLVESGCMDDAWKVPRKEIIKQYEEIKVKLDKLKVEKKRIDKKREILGGESLFDTDITDINV